eukprot:403352331
MQTSNYHQKKIYEKELQNFMDIQYMGTLYLGSQQEKMTFIFDTGSSWLWAPTVECTECHTSERYDTSISETYEKLASDPTRIVYGSGKVRGFFSQDQVCLTPGETLATCITDYRFLAVDKTQDLDRLKADGVLGLAPSSQRTRASLFIDELYQNGIIDNRIFAFYMAEDGQMNPEDSQQSKILFGGYNSSYFQDTKYAKYFNVNYSMEVSSETGKQRQVQPTWNELINTNYWSLQLVGVKLGDKVLQLSSNVAIVDTGTSYLLMPNPDFDQLVNYFQSNNICGQDQQKNLFKCLCTDQIYQHYPDIHIQIGNNVYTIPKEQYIIPINGNCYFLIMNMTFSQGTGVWILGDNFLQNYVAVFDYDNMRVGFIGESYEEDIPKTVIEYLTYVVSGLLVVVIIFVVVHLCCNGQKDQDGEDGYYGFHRTRSSERRYTGNQTGTFQGDSNSAIYSQQLLPREGSGVSYGPSTNTGTAGGSNTNQQRLLD